MENNVQHCDSADKERYLNSHISLPTNITILHNTHAQRQTGTQTHTSLSAWQLLLSPVRASVGHIRTTCWLPDSVCSDTKFFSPLFFGLMDTISGWKKALFKLMTAVGTEGNHWKEYIKQHHSVCLSSPPSLPTSKVCAHPEPTELQIAAVHAG